MKIEDCCLRSGDFTGNATQLLDCVKDAAKVGVKELVIPCDALQGGDCGSLATHPAFVKLVHAAEEKFLKAVAKVKGAPKLVKGAPLARTPVAKGPDPRLPFCGRPAEVFACQVAGLVRRLKSMPWCHDVVLGLSGGLDSALALLVSVAAFEALGYEKKGIHVVTMPGFGTTKRTRGNADLLCEGLGLALETIDITPACRQHFKDIHQPASRVDVVFENTQARERTQILMDMSNQCNGIVIGTGDMSEIALGWSTYNGDHMSMFAVNAGVPKTAVRDVCRWWAEERVKGLKVKGLKIKGLKSVGVEVKGLKGGGEVKAAEALLDIIATPVSPELLPAKRGEIQQKTEDKIGPYELHDFFLWHFIADQEDSKEILRAAKKAFRGTYDAATIEKWLNLFFKRFFSQAFKRNCAPDGIPVYEVFLGPTAWHIPSEMCAIF